MAVIRSSYYAMFHAARAVLFKATGDAPKRHDRVIQQFGLRARDLDEAMRAAGRAFNAAKDVRNAADYDEAVLSSQKTHANRCDRPAIFSRSAMRATGSV